MLESIIQQIEAVFHPHKVLLFGSHAKGTSNKQSDIDLCIVAETLSKRDTLTEMYFGIKSDLPLDIILYTPEEWSIYVKDPMSFAAQIDREGLVLYQIPGFSTTRK
jgi:predicted nucleotidyltransferase